ncbi:MAG: hypothetical protein mread185_000481 [Mycoplasmataceae bacterium]|nr:MAG: hypothetical protein mread185_000481 [Mycoplasmataceae bacterium]
MKISEYLVGKKIAVNDKMQKRYHYLLSKEIGELASDFHQFDFWPKLTPEQMLNYGVFEGKYLNDCQEELPEEWFINSRDKRSEIADVKFNYFKTKSRQSLRTWQEKKWIIGDDPRGWFQWYCRYYLGRRTDYDNKQIARWKSFKRHLGQIRKNCSVKDLNCRPRQRQALLQWAYNPFI